MYRIFILFFSLNFTFAYEISFKDALNLALKNNKNLQINSLDIQKSKQNLKQVQALNFGELKLQSIYSRTNHASYVFNSKLSSREVTQEDFSRLNIKSEKNNLETKLIYDFPIFTGFKIQNASKISKLQIKARKKNYLHIKNNLSYEVLKAYNSCVSTKELVKAIKKAKLASMAYVVYASELYKEGLVTKIDVKQAKVRDFNINAKEEEAKNNLTLAISYLQFLSDDKNITDVKNFENFNNFKSINNHKIKGSNLEYLQNQALLNRFDLKSLKLHTLLSKKAIEIEQSIYYPQIGAHIEYGYNNDKIQNFDSLHNFYLASISLEYKLFDLKTFAKIRLSKIKLNQMKLQETYLKDAIRLEVKENYLQVKTKQKILKEKLRAKDLAEDILLQATELYKNHLINMSDLLNHQALRQEARAAAIYSKYELSLSFAKLKVSLGSSLKTKE